MRRTDHDHNPYWFSDWQHACCCPHPDWHHPDSDPAQKATDPEKKKGFRRGRLIPYAPPLGATRLILVEYNVLLPGNVREKGGFEPAGISVEFS